MLHDPRKDYEISMKMTIEKIKGLLILRKRSDKFYFGEKGEGEGTHQKSRDGSPYKAQGQ